MRTVVLDIETAARPWLELSGSVRERLVSGSRDARDYRSRRERLSLSPFTAHVIAIALLDVDGSSGTVWLDPTGSASPPPEREGSFAFVAAGEREMLASLWQEIADVARVVTFNGRAFDGPFLALRSAVHSLVPTRPLAGRGPTRTPDGAFEHVDLLEVLSFQGLLTKPSLDLACLAFDVPSPKTGEVRGEKVGEAFRRGRIAEIARYARRDVEATAELWRRVSTTLLAPPRSGR